jgi:putative tributyrin esterase
MLIQLKHGSQSLEFGMHVHVIIPEKTPPEGGFKTLYLLHGYFGDFTDWLYASNIMRYAEKYDLVIVMPDGRNSYYVNHPNGLRFKDYITNDLIKRVEETFRVSTNKKDRYIAGLSMGGFGALYLGLHHPALFSKIAALSPVIEIQHMEDHFNQQERVYHFHTLFGKNDINKSHLDLYKHALEMKEQDLYISIGKDDFLIEENRRFHAFLNTHHMPHTYLEKDGNHDWKFWDDAIQDVLKWLFS